MRWRAVAQHFESLCSPIRRGRGLPGLTEGSRAMDLKDGEIEARGNSFWYVWEVDKGYEAERILPCWQIERMSCREGDVNRNDTNRRGRSDRVGIGS
jgi:hypothetical protein